MTKLFPSILPNSDEPFVDSKYQRAELERMEYDDLRTIAADHESGDVNGRMPKKELIAKLEGKQRV